MNSYKNTDAIRIKHVEYLGLCVRQLRVESGMSRRKLAEKSNISESTIRRLEKCNLRVTIESIIKILYGLGYTLSIRDDTFFLVNLEKGDEK